MTARSRNRDKERAYARAYYKANGERLRAAARARNLAKREDVRAYAKVWRANDRNRNRLVYMLVSAKKRAAQRGIAFEISENDLVIPEICPVLGIPIVIQSGRHDGAPSIDRIDNSLGYIKGNVRIISYRANAIKRDMTLEEAQLLVKNWSAK